MVENTGICLEACVDGYYQSSENTCNKCEAPCKDCEGTANTCLSCLDTGEYRFFDMVSQTCFNACPFGYTDINNVCHECESPCLTCEGDVDYCTVCDGYNVLIYLDGFICRPWCEDGYVVNPYNETNLKCEPCDVAQCKICDIDALDQCLECMPGYYVYEGMCVSDCPEDFRIGDEEKHCVRITINDLGIFYFPFLMIAGILSLIVIFGKCKKK